MRGKFVEMLGARGQAMLVPAKIARHKPAANTAATVTISPPDSKMSVVIVGLSAHYSDTTKNGVVDIAVDAVTVNDYMIKGGDYLDFHAPVQYETGKDVVVTLPAGGAGVTGTLNVHYVIAEGVGG